jgi:hypothetical protein
MRWEWTLVLVAACSTAPSTGSYTPAQGPAKPQFGTDAGVSDTGLAKDATATDVKLADGTTSDTATGDAKIDTAPTDVPPVDVLIDSGNDTAEVDVQADVLPDVPAEVAEDAGPVCGDKSCDSPDEDCKSCPQDCGKCPVAGCGDGKCVAPENCQTCPKDCGACPDFCGDKTCKGDEDCKSCPGDCGACPEKCGDGACTSGENCGNCAADCGQCPGPCDPLTSDKCEANQQCYPLSPTNAICSPFGKLAKGQTCEGLDACGKGMLCVAGVCNYLCNVTGKTPPAKCVAPAQCIELQSGNKPTGWNMGACLGDACNLPSNAPCQSGQTCIPTKTGKQCIKAGTKGLGATCAGNDECLATLLCVGSGQGTCKQRCHSGGGTPKCPGGQQCQFVTIGQDGEPAGDNLGICN